MGTVKYTGPVASFHCPTNADIRSLKVHFSPKQLGEGTPSPDNVREIVGWDGVEVYHGNKTVIWNQWLKPYDSTNWTPYSTHINATFSDGIATSEWVDTNTGYSASIKNTIGTLQSEGQIWYASYMVKSDKNYAYGIEFCGGRQHRGVVFTETNEWYHVSAVDSFYRGTRNYTYVANCSSSSSDDMIGMIVYSKSPLLINLTQMFGAGNEPTKEEFESQCLLNGIDLTEYHDYSEGIEILWKTNNTETYQVEFPVLGKNKFPLTASTTIENIKTGYDNKVVRDVTSTSIYQNVSANNYWVGSTTSSYISSVGNGEITFSSTDGSYGAGMFVPVIPNQTYIVSGNSEKVRFRVGYYNDDGTFSGQHFIANKAFTVPAEYHYAFIVVVPLADYYNQEITVSNIQIELGSTATTYEPYNPNHTVYGGWVDLISGEVREEWNTICVKDLPGEWSYKSSNTRFQITLPSQYLNGPTGAWNNENIMSETYKTSSSNGYGDKQIAQYSNRYVYIRDDDFEGDVDAFLAAVGNTKIAYKLPTSISYTLAPTELQTFLGTNNVWSNADYVEVEYDLHETQDILARKQFIVASQPHVEEASGAIATFTTDMAAKLKECKVGFKPVQDLHGYSKPWVGGAGKNLFNAATSIPKKYIDATGNINISDDWSASDFIAAKAETTYALTAPTSASSNTARIAFYDGNQEFISSFGAQEVEANNNVFTTPTNTAYIKISVRTETPTAVQLEVGSIATSYEPYENICQISGWGNIEINQSGKNLNNNWLKPEGITASGYYNGYSSWAKDWAVPASLIGVTLRYSAFIDNTGTTDTRDAYLHIWTKDINGTYIRTNATSTTHLNPGESGRLVASITPRDTEAFISCGLTMPAGCKASEPLLEIGSIETDYEPYHGTTIPITFPYEAGTIYGGYVDLVTGELVQTWNYIRANERTWSNYSAYQVFYTNKSDRSADSRDISDKLKSYTGYGWANAPDNSIISGNRNSMFIKHLGVSSKAEFKEWLDEVDPIIYYELAEPIHYTLTPTQLKSLRGINNIYSNTNDNISIQYWKH